MRGAEGKTSGVTDDGWIPLEEAAERAGFADKNDLLRSLPSVLFDDASMDQGPTEILASYLENWMARRVVLMLEVDAPAVRSRG